MQSEESNTPDPEASQSSDPAGAPTEEKIVEVGVEDLTPAQKQAIDNAGWTKLMPVQARALPVMSDGKDVMVQSRTGSGKTGGFLLPLLDRLDKDEKAAQALILVPTRELALQVAKEAEMLCNPAGFASIAVYGGVRYKAQLEAFRQGAPIVIGTPGRILDHLLRGSLKLDNLRALVLDEADRMLSMGFLPDMKRIREFLPRDHVPTAFFSATFPPHVVGLASQFLVDPVTLSLSRDHVHVTDTTHLYYRVPALKKDRCMLRIIEVENPANAIIFCNTKVKVNYVTAVLRGFGYDADELSADRSQAAREQVLDRVRDGTLRFLVATDVAARGIDIPALSHVIQYEPPEDPESYIHRAGRTGRAGATGEAITLVAGIEELEIKRIGKRFEIDFEEREAPTEEEVANVVGERTTALLEAALREKDTLQVERMERFKPLARSLGEDITRLLAMLLDDFYQASSRAGAHGGGAQTQGPRPRGRRSRLARSRAATPGPAPRLKISSRKTGLRAYQRALSCEAGRRNIRDDHGRTHLLPGGWSPLLSV